MSDVALRLSGISKRFGAVAALSDVSLELKPGEVIGLVGENGSGKSTLVKVITGYHAPERGARGEVWGSELSFPVVSHQKLGIAVIHQDLGLVDAMTVVENLGISSGYHSAHVRPVRWRAEAARCAAELEEFGAQLDVHALVGSLSPAERAIVAIVRAARELKAGKTQGEIFILDEPTAYLTHAEATRVLALMRTVADRGSSVIFISHHLNEVITATNRAVVLRDGRVVADLPTRGLTEAELIARMLGREIESFYPDKARRTGTGDVVLEVSELRGRIVDGISFQLRRGEILGMTGLAGMGQQELPYLVAGAHRPVGGTVLGASRARVTSSPAAARRAGIVLVPGNRLRDGGWGLASASENLTLARLGSYYRRGWLRQRDERVRSRELMRLFGVRPLDETLPLAHFSGGNQQKIMLAKWLQDDCQVLLLDEPTQGVDAGARREILTIVRDVAARGTGVVIFSSDFEQLANVCTRVVSLSRGRAVGALEGAEVTEDNLMTMCQAA